MCRDLHRGGRVGNDATVTLVGEVAGWAAGLEIDDVPDDVLVLCRAQRRSVFAAIAASSNDEAACRVLDAITAWAGRGPAPLIGNGDRSEGTRSVSVDDAIYGASALSIALDFDDYVCFGHTSHSAVLVPLLLSCETGSSGVEQLLAQVIANEMGARLGGACLLGPLNGQLESFIHAGASALAAGRLFGLDHQRLAHALAISLTNAPRPTVPGFMAPDTKLTTAAEPTLAGLRAARLAASGVTGPLDVLEHGHGFFDAFSYAPLRGMFGRLGEGWATRTLSVKRYPGCAYIDTTIDALSELVLPPAGGVDSIDSVIVHAGLMTCGMDALSSEYTHDPTPVTVNFSIGLNVAIMLLAGKLTADEVSGGWLRSHATDLNRIAGKVKLRHDWEGTKRSVAAFGGLLPVGAIIHDTGRAPLIRALRRLRADHRNFDVGFADIVDLLRLGPGALVEITSLARCRGNSEAPGGIGFWSPQALERFAMTFPARVEVRYRDGRVEKAEADVPLGGAGHQSCGPVEAAAHKFAVWAPRLWDEDHSAAIDSAIDTDADDLAFLLGRPT
jgi:2-methylcitrate dehydratase PrpD